MESVKKLVLLPSNEWEKLKKVYDIEDDVIQQLETVELPAAESAAADAAEGAPEGKMFPTPNTKGISQKY